MAETERRIGDLTVRIDRDSCISSGNCVKVAPGLFELDDEAIVVFAKTADDASSEQVTEACEICPVEALTVTDSSGKQIVP
ncbi:MAG TPA: ferredoxin [bacterium]|nr:ferredoxin [bacterium]